MARLFDSDPPEVKTTSDGRQPRHPATCSRARSSAAFAFRPSAWVDEGLPNPPVRNGSIASATRGSMGVVAL
jgi:hypothetical protein